jgi:hypothetical protein
LKLEHDFAIKEIEGINNQESERFASESKINIKKHEEKVYQLE